MGAPLQKVSLINDIFQKCHWTMTFFNFSISKIVIDRSMTILKGLETCPWVHLYRKCHWSMTVFKIVIDQWQFLKLSLIDQWQFWKGIKTCPCMHLYKNCHWSINDNFERYRELSMYAPLQKMSLIDQLQFWKVSRPVHVCTFTENVIDQWQFQKCHWSMTVSKIVIDRSMTISKIVIDRSMTILKGIETCPCMHLYRKCHWSMTVSKVSLVNDSF